MVHKILPGLLLALGTFTATAQTAASSEGCGCARNFAETQRLMAANYAGYHDKVTAATRPRLDSLTRAVQAQADTAGAAACGPIIYQWLRFFKDRHISIQPPDLTEGQRQAIRSRFAPAPRVTWTRTSFRQYLDDPTRPKQPLEGVWRAEDGTYQVGVVQNGNGRYQGFVLKADSLWWMPGQVKFELTAAAPDSGAVLYRMQNHTAQTRRYRLLADGVLTMDARWYREYPRPVALPVAAKPALHQFRMLDDTTALFRIGSFSGRYRPLIDSLTKAHAADLQRTRLLILDVRDNGGGSDGSYRSLMPYLYTQPFEEVSAALWSTPDNNRRYDIAFFPDMSAQEKQEIHALQTRLNRQVGQLVPIDAGGKQVQTVRLPRRQQHPELARVAILQNRGCASSTEQFLLMARQSRKTTLFGENTGGVLDYSNMNFQPLPCDGYTLGWATSRSYRLSRGQAIDGVGIAPAVRINPQAPDAVEQVRQWYRQPPR